MNKTKIITIIENCIANLEAESKWSDFYDMLYPYEEKLYQALEELKKD